MLRLDYLSCLLTIGSTVLIGRRMWQGWVIAAVNSLIVCAIGVRTAQLGFVPANLFCIAIYAHNISTWRALRKDRSSSMMEQRSGAVIRGLELPAGDQ